MIHGLLHNGFTKFVKGRIRRLLGKEGVFVSLKDYARKHPESISFLSQGKETTIYAENRRNMLYENILQSGEEIDTSVALVKKGSCFAYSDLILLDNRHYYCEIKKDPVIGRASNCADGYVLKSDKKHYYEVKIPTKKQNIKEGIFLSGLFSWNYYHFTYQIVSKLQWVEKVAPEVPLLVDGKALEIPSFASLLRICNIQNRAVVVLEANVQYAVDELYLVSSQTILLPNFKLGVPHPETVCYYRPSTLRYLRDRIIPFGTCLPDSPKKIFLGRKYVTSGRRPFNEEECIACAQEFGFEVVYPELMSFEQQVGLFNNAEFIIGGSGAAFTNLVYCNNKVKVVAFYKFHSSLGLWQTIIEYIGGKMCFLEENPEEEFVPQQLHAPFHVDIDKLKSILNEIV